MMLPTLAAAAWLLAQAAQAAPAKTTGTPAAPIRITVDAAANRHPISPLIYGVNFATTKALADLNAPLNRTGGDNASLYNWVLDARNAGRDWFFESTPCPPDIYGQFGDNFVGLTQRGGARPMLTIPMIGWVAALGPGRTKLASFSIAKYGLQQKTDTVGFAEAGNGVHLDGQLIRNNDPHDAARPDTVSDEAAWLHHLVARWKPASAGGVPFYILDNEPSRWQDIHRDVHPLGAHASEIAAKTIAYATMVKSIDPSAKVVAPEEWGWTGYLDSGFDQQRRESNDSSAPSDRSRETNGTDLLPWLLTQWKKAGHPIDVVSVHFYPQQGEYHDGSDDVSEAMQLIRNRSTRLLWDGNYLDPSWMHDKIALIPRMRAWVDRFYWPGTPIALTEYNWGGEKSMNGATTQADILGIFGREGLDIANRWATPAEGSPTYLAMKLFRNYDGHDSGFGETSVAANAPDPDTISAFAALRKRDGALTIVIINKQLKTPAKIDLQLSSFAHQGRVDAVRLVDGRIVTLPTSQYSNSSLATTLPSQSVTLFLFYKDRSGR